MEKAAATAPCARDYSEWTVDSCDDCRLADWWWPLALKANPYCIMLEMLQLIHLSLSLPPHHPLSLCVRVSYNIHPSEPSRFAELEHCVRRKNDFWICSHGKWIIDISCGPRPYQPLRWNNSDGECSFAQTQKLLSALFEFPSSMGLIQ